ncbi:hypothetical protein Q8G50_32190, partial [Klebsiella pneumoniae]
MTIPELQQVVEAQRQLRDWCLQNPDGAVCDEGKTSEKVVAPEEVRRMLIGATRLIEDAPRRAQEIQARMQ